MADDNEKIETTEEQAVTTEEQIEVTEPETEVAKTESEDESIEPSETERLTSQMSELQGKFDNLSQDAAKNKQMLNEVTPYVNFDAMKSGLGGSNDDEEEDTFLSQKEAKALEQRIEQKIATNNFLRDFRTQYPDLADKGVKEDMVRFFFENKTLRNDSFDKRLESAVGAARSLLKSEQSKGEAKTKTALEKEAAAVKAKAEAAAKASGLSSTGITSPQKASKNEPQTPSDYIAERREHQKKLKL